MEAQTPSQLPWVWIFIAFLASIPLTTIVLLFTAPGHYDHYNPDFVEEIRPDRSMADVERIEKEAQETDHHLPAPGEGYARFNKHRETNKKLRYENSCTIVVLGDIARSPRMVYHAASLAKRNVRVEIVGYVESPLPSHLKGTKHIRVHPLKSLPSTLNYLPFLLIAPFKLIHQSWMLYHALSYRVKTATRHMLLQVPPSMPAMHVCLFVCAIRNTRLICDWHNTAASVLALRFGRNQGHPLVWLLRKYELSLGRNAFRHLAVTEAMKRYLVKSADFPENKVTVLRDRPAESFVPLQSLSERKDFLAGCEYTNQYVDELTKQKAAWKLLVSSTSWSSDEDFGVLLDALIAYSSKTQASASLPNLLVIITGKGPSQKAYLKRIADLNQQRKLDKVVIRTGFLPHEQYARLLASADLGVCLHNSSSGLDLPMKVADMFGAGLPVAVWSGYEALSELLKNGSNGVGFDSAGPLATSLERLLSNDGQRELVKLRDGALREGELRWDDAWQSTAAGTFDLIYD